MAATSTIPPRCDASDSSTGGSAAISPRAVVTGAAGFIGSHLCEALERRGYDVLAVDDLSTGSWHNLRGPGRRIATQTQDVSEPFEVEGAVDVVIHAASRAAPRAYMNAPIETLRVGTVGTFNMLELARRTGARFLFTSTSEVYGDPLVHPQHEEYWGNVNPIGPRSCYDESKRAGEAIVAAYRTVHRIDTRIVRIFNTYGPRMSPHDSRAIPTFIGQALRGDPVTVHGDGSQTRSLCYISDLVAGTLAVLDRGDDRPVNLGSPEEVSVLELARQIMAAVGSRSEIRFVERPRDDPERRRPVIDRARGLGWAPVVSLEEGLARTISAMRSATVA